MPKINNIGISLSKPVKLLIALTAIYKVSSLLIPFSSKKKKIYIYSIMAYNITLLF